MQKNKNNEDVLKLIGTHDFSKIRDMSKNKVFKNLSNNSNDSSSQGDEADNVVLTIGNVPINENKTENSQESKDISNNEAKYEN